MSSIVTLTMEYDSCKAGSAHGRLVAHIQVSNTVHRWRKSSYLFVRQSFWYILKRVCMEHLSRVVFSCVSNSTRLPLEGHVLGRGNKHTLMICETFCFDGDQEPQDANVDLAYWQGTCVCEGALSGKCRMDLIWTHMYQNA